MLRSIEKTEIPRINHPIDSPNGIIGQIGNTPLILLDRIAAQEGIMDGVQLYGKAEWFNPSGSVKDRPALNIIRTAEWQGLLKPGMTILDSTSGNMGISYAMIGAARGYKVKLALPENASPERITVLRAYGAELLFTDPLDGSDGAQLQAKQLAADSGDDTFYADQYNNPANWEAHYYTTANEIWSQTSGTVTHFVAGVGTSGTLVGTTRRLSELNHSIKIIAMQPDSPFHGLEGLKHMPSSIRPGIYDAELADRKIDIRTEEAYEMAKSLARLEGLFVGVSSAAAVAAAVKIGQQLDHGVVVTVLPDSGLKYLSERFWNGK
jgi:cysteine synthase B